MGPRTLEGPRSLCAVSVDVAHPLLLRVVLSQCGSPTVWRCLIQCRSLYAPNVLLSHSAWLAGRKCYKIPLLQDVFAAVPKTTKFIIEFKLESLELIQKVHELAQAQGRLEHIVWFSLKSAINQQLAAFDPQIPRIMSVSSVFRVTLLFLLGLLPFVQVDDQIFGVKAGPVNIGLLQKMEAFRRCPLTVQRGVAKMVLGLFEWAKRPLSKHLARRGFPCWVLGVNDEAGLQEAISVGAKGMLTDRPAWLGSVASGGAPREQHETDDLL